jgi:hypothetical protein
MTKSELHPLSLYSFAMKTSLRVVLSVALIVWLGAEAFFPIVAANVFGVLQPDTHTAGIIVGQLLRILHGIGLVAGMIALAAISLLAAKNVFHPRRVLLPVLLLIIMVGLTLFSQFVIIPAMEQDRISAGGDVKAAAISNPARIDFERLHTRSEQVEGLILFLGLGLVILLAKEESTKD